MCSNKPLWNLDGANESTATYMAQLVTQGPCRARVPLTHAWGAAPGGMCH